MKNILVCFFLLQIHCLLAQNVTINNVPTYPLVPVDPAHVGNLVQLSKNNMGQTVLNSIFPPGFSSSRWHAGSWFRGYYSINDTNTFQYTPTNPGCGGTGNPCKYWGSHPLPRDASRQIRSMIHLHNRYATDPIVNDNINMILNGLDYLMFYQQTDGSYINWESRPSQNVPNTTEQTVYNTSHVYETAHALATMCDGYMYLKKINYPYSQYSTLYNSIVKAANNILNKNVNANTDVDYNNSNYKSFGAWGLAKAYKITNNCYYLVKAREICQNLIDAQTKDGSLCNGTWQTGGADGPNNGANHDNAIWYHLIILRGMIETFDLIPPTMGSFKNDLANAIKRGINHVILGRISQSNEDNNYYLGALRPWWLASNCGTYQYAFSHMYWADVVEPIALLAYYANYHTGYFSTSEKTSLQNLLNLISCKIVVATTNSPTTLQSLGSLAYYVDYINAINTGQKVFPEDAKQIRNYDATKISNRTVVGDFDNDGKQDDIAGFYDYGNSETRIHVWKSNNNIFEYMNGTSGWWSANGYNTNQIKGVVTGDFDGDNYVDDIAVLYDYGNSETRIHVWKGQGSFFSYMGNTGFWSVIGYDANKVVGRVVSGDFDGDGRFDDIAAFYDYGNSQTRIHVWTGQNSYFYYTGATGFWNITGYGANNITGRIVPGDFDNDGKFDDIAAFYD